jgi:Flp pilus assembly protein TadG
VVAQHTERRSRRSESGASAVEFALVLPILIILVFGVISFGIVLAQKLALGNAAREASRYGVVEGRTCTQVTAAATNAATTIGMNGGAVTVSVTRGTTEVLATNACPSGPTKPCTGAVAGDSLFVKLTFGSTVDIPLVMSHTVTLTGTGVFRCEYS